METLQLKQNLHEMIDRIADNRVLEAIHTLLLQVKHEDTAADEWVTNEATRKTFDERIAYHKAHPDEGDSWPNVKARIEKKLEERHRAADQKSA